jgi:hypothetical protein
MDNLVSSTRANLESLYDLIMRYLDKYDVLEDDCFKSLYQEIEELIKLRCKEYKIVKEALDAYFEFVCRKSRGVLYGDKYKEGPTTKEETLENPERQIEWTKFFENLESAEELKDFMLKMKRVLHFIVLGDTLESAGRSLGFLNLSVSEEFRLLILNAMNSQNWEEVESLIMPIAVAFCRRFDAFVISTALLLSVVYRYLIALVDRGGGKTYSSGSLDFRSIYISIVLFQGAYVWIKFREVAPPSQQKPSPGLYRKWRTNVMGVKVYYGNFEPRFKPPGENYVSVGSYEEEEDAKKIYQILAFYYGKDVPSELPLPFGNPFHIPHMTDEEQRLNPEEKKTWAQDKAKAVYEDYKLFEEYAVRGCLMDQPTEDLPNIVLPLLEVSDPGASVVGRMDSIGVQADEAHPFQFGNQGDNLGRDISPSNPNIGPVTQGMQEHMANNTLSGPVGGDASHLALPETATNMPANGAGALGEQPLDPQFQHGSLQENQANSSANNLVLDDLSLVRLVKELQRQQQLQQLQSQQLESRIQEQEHQSQQQETRNQQLETRISELERQQQLQQLQSHQQESRILELEVEVERLRSTEHARKQSCPGFTPRHNSED